MYVKGDFILLCFLLSEGTATQGLMKIYFSRSEFYYFERKNPCFRKILIMHLEITQNPLFLEKTVQCYKYKRRYRLRSVLLHSVN